MGSLPLTKNHHYNTCQTVKTEWMMMPSLKKCNVIFTFKVYLKNKKLVYYFLHRLIFCNKKMGKDHIGLKGIN